jgi:orotidine-5'-phosphate decarboxylase
VTFGARLLAAVGEHGPLCVGVDPHPGLLAEWGLTDDADGCERFAMACVAAFAGHVAVLKPQSAFFERHGSAGVAVLERLLAALAGTSTLSLLDVKRGDIGSTMDGYADAYLGVGAPLAADAVTLAPYLGLGALAPAIRTAEDAGRGVFVLARTSNPEGAEVQLADFAGRSVAQTVVDGVGAVLAPGLGAQGAQARDVAGLFAGVDGIVLPAAARSVLRHGPDPVALRAAAVALRDELVAAGE